MTKQKMNARTEKLMFANVNKESARYKAAESKVTKRAKRKYPNIKWD